MLKVAAHTEMDGIRQNQEQQTVVQKAYSMIDDKDRKIAERDMKLSKYKQKIQLLKAVSMNTD